MRAVVIGASGAVGGALYERLKANGVAVTGFSRRGEPSLDITQEDMVQAAAVHAGNDLDLVIVATGFLHDGTFSPEKSLRYLSSEHLLASMARNAVGPALVMKHFLPRLARGKRSVLAVLSARVGSIGDNHLGGWYSYRAAKAALNQLVRTAAVELARTHPRSACIALHPGTVDTPLSAPFHRNPHNLQNPQDAARKLLAVLDTVGPEQSGAFLDYAGATIPY